MLERSRELFITDLVFAATGGMGPTRKLAASGRERNMRFRLCLRSLAMCVRGHCSSFRRLLTSDIDLAYSEGRLESGDLV